MANHKPKKPDCLKYFKESVESEKENCMFLKICLASN
jgi:hypothetical protein